jgi:GAF domain-containing protein
VKVTSLANHDFAVRMADLARTLAHERTLDAVLAEVTAAAVELIPGVDTAGILLVKPRGGFESLATTSELPHQLDILQMTFDEGPCVQAALADTIVRTDDFRTESRWPQYSPAVVDIGVLSGLSFKLYTGERTAGALNLFGFQPRQWEADDESVGSVLAAHAAAAIIATQQEQQLQAALMTRDRIGQAKGIIMERFGVDGVRAFEMLRQLSQEGNIKLVELADRVIDTRHGRSDLHPGV